MINEHLLVLNSGEADTSPLNNLWQELQRKKFQISQLSLSGEHRCNFFRTFPKGLFSLVLFVVLSPIFCLMLVIRYKKIGQPKTIVTTGLTDTYLVALMRMLFNFKHLWLVLPELEDRVVRSSLLRRICKKAVILVQTSHGQTRMEQAGYKNRKVLLLPAYELVQKTRQDNIFNNIVKAQQPTRKFFTIGTIAELTKGAHIENLLKAAKEASELIPNLQLIIVGEGPEKKNLQWIAKQLGIASMVWFVGQNERAQKWLDNLDIYVVSKPYLSLKEQVFILEIMERRLPVLADISSGLDDIIFEGKTGRLLNFAHSSELADAIVTLEQDLDRRRHMGQLANERVLKMFSQAAQLDQFAKVL